MNSEPVRRAFAGTFGEMSEKHETSTMSIKSVVLQKHNLYIISLRVSRSAVRTHIPNSQAQCGCFDQEKPRMYRYGTPYSLGSPTSATLLSLPGICVHDRCKRGWGDTKGVMRK